MKKSASSEVKRGQAISFRIPADTPDHILKQLQRLKETEKRNFSSRIAQYVLEGVNHSYTRDQEAITISLPKKLTKEQRDWLKHEHSEALLGSIIYQLITDPIRSTAILASFNSKSVDIDEALYLQEEEPYEEPLMEAGKQEEPVSEEATANHDFSSLDDDLSDFDWESAKQQASAAEETSGDEEDNLDDLLGDFLAKMNK